MLVLRRLVIREKLDLKLSKARRSLLDSASELSDYFTYDYLRHNQPNLLRFA